MTLKDTRQKINDPSWEGQEHKHEKSQFNPMISAGEDTDKYQEAQEQWGITKKGFSLKQKRIISGGVIAILSIITFLALFWLIVFIKNSFFLQEKVYVTIDGPSLVDSVNPVSYKIKYSNKNRAKLKDVELRLNYPENFVPSEQMVNFKRINDTSGQFYIGEVASYSEGEVEVIGSFYAPKNYSIFLKPVLRYQPSNSSSYFEAETQLAINVKTPPLAVEITAPIEVASGGSAEYLIQYQNKSKVDLEEKMRLKIEFPEGFEFSESDPMASEGNNIWYLGSISAGQKGEIRIKGTLQGQQDEGKIIKAYLGTIRENGVLFEYAQEEKVTKIIGSPFFITQTINGLGKINVNAGDELEYEISYRNEGEIGLRDVIVTMDLESPILDYASVEFDGGIEGFYDISKQRITWKAANVSGLERMEVQEEGSVNFIIRVLEVIPVKNINDKNFKIVSIARIDSPDVSTPVWSNKVISSNRTEIKLNSKVDVAVSYNYNDLNIPNTGPYPFVMDQETTLTCVFQLTNLYNDIADVKVESYLPSWIQWAGKVYPESEEVSYNERTNKIVWNLGNIKNGVGILDPPRVMKFQIAFTPQVYHKGQDVIILKEGVFTARDLFTEEDIRFTTSSASVKVYDSIYTPPVDPLNP